MESLLLSHLLLLFIVCFSTLHALARGELPGTWELLVPNAGIASMHSAVTHYNTVVLLDRTDIGASRLRLPKGHCRRDPHDQALKIDCFAHSVELHLPTNQIRPLTILSDTWCSSGQFLPDGTLLQTGGAFDGSRKFRKFSPCNPDRLCDWEELAEPQLDAARWYATNQILPDGSVIIVGGEAANSVEFYPPRLHGATQLPFLAAAADEQMDNLYPYVHLLPNNHLFIFANNKAVMYDYTSNSIKREYPPLDGGPRNYPSAGSSAMLALEGDYSTAVIVVCGGAQFGAFLDRSTDTPAHGSCGRIIATDPNPVWELEDMPFARIMGDMVMLPTGEVLIINGAQSGTQGFDLASNPCLNPVLYRPGQPVGLRFMVLNPGTFVATKFPTELRIEAFSPEYLARDRGNLRPVIEEAPEVVRYGERFEVVVSVELPVVAVVEVNLGSAPFSTHSFSQGQRLVKLGVAPALDEMRGRWRIVCTAPPNAVVAPPGYYMAFAVNQGVPSVAKWVQLYINGRGLQAIFPLQVLSLSFVILPVQFGDPPQCNTVCVLLVGPSFSSLFAERIFHSSSVCAFHRSSVCVLLIGMSSLPACCCRTITIVWRMNFSQQLLCSCVHASCRPLSSLCSRTNFLQQPCVRTSHRHVVVTEFSLPDRRHCLQDELFAIVLVFMCTCFSSALLQPFLRRHYLLDCHI
ncbi:hypothetical protein Sjap_013446 [Stephania japonica]|uniref:Glyoxal oxidase n=1 Tax=Stephania japonica TaxID=461633 RepID=A0AAP0IXX3_9MAGN